MYFYQYFFSFIECYKLCFALVEMDFQEGIAAIAQQKLHICMQITCRRPILSRFRTLARMALLTVRTDGAPREVRWERGGHERLRYTLSPLQHYSKTQYVICAQCTALLGYNGFGIGIGGVRMLSKTTLTPSLFPSRLLVGRGQWFYPP
jgi:hypothetical protein